jgi:microcystin-dependent protein
MKTFKCILTAMMILSFSNLAAAQDTEEITLTTYYPAPYGDYDHISVNEIKFTPHNSPSSALNNAGNMYFDATEGNLKISDGSDYQGVGGVPAGAVMAFAMPTAPAGWLICDGSTVAKDDYPTLFAAIGYTYGGSGTNFRLPNYQGYFLRGLGGVDPDAPIRTIGSIQQDRFQSHRHLDPNATNVGTDQLPASSAYTPDFNPATWTSYDEFTINDGPCNETRPKNIAVQYCIKY